MGEGMVRAGEWLRRNVLSIGICLILVIAGIYVLMLFGKRLGGAGSYLFLLVCPLMHLFMHRGHGGHGSGPDKDSIQRKEHHQN